MTDESGRGGRVVPTLLGAGAVVVVLAVVAVAGHRSMAAPAHGAPARPEPPSPTMSSDIVEVPLVERGGVLTVPVAGPDGAELTFALSTGEVGPVLSESAARRLSGAQHVSLGTLRVPVEGARVAPDGRLVSGGTHVDGVIGVGTLADFDILVDLPGGRLLLGSPGASSAWPGVTLSEPIKIRVYHGVAIGLDVTVDGRAYLASLDLAQRSVALNEPAWRALGLVAGGEVSLGVGGQVLAGLPAHARDDAVMERWDPDARGFVIVGAPLAYDCALSVSWAYAEIRTCVR